MTGVLVDHFSLNWVAEGVVVWEFEVPANSMYQGETNDAFRVYVPADARTDIELPDGTIENARDAY